MGSMTGLNKISVLTESWKYDQKIFSNIIFDAFYSFSRSINDRSGYNFWFDEPFAYDTSTYNQSLEIVQEIAKNDSVNMALSRYDFDQNISNENEKSFGANLKYNFRLSNLISGNLKFGFKNRTKKRSYNRHHEFGNVAAAAGPF